MRFRTHFTVTFSRKNRKYSYFSCFVFFFDRFSWVRSIWYSNDFGYMYVFILKNYDRSWHRRTVYDGRLGHIWLLRVGSNGYYAKYRRRSSLATVARYCVRKGIIIHDGFINICFLQCCKKCCTTLFLIPTLAVLLPDVHEHHFSTVLKIFQCPKKQLLIGWWTNLKKSIVLVLNQN